MFPILLSVLMLETNWSKRYRHMSSLCSRSMIWVLIVSTLGRQWSSFWNGYADCWQVKHFHRGQILFPIKRRREWRRGHYSTWGFSTGSLVLIQCWVRQVSAFKMRMVHSRRQTISQRNRGLHNVFTWMKARRTGYIIYRVPVQNGKARPLLINS